MASLELQPPSALKPIQKEEAHGLVPITEDEKSDLETRIGEFINTIITSDAQSQDFQDRIKAIHQMGNSELRNAVSVSNRMMQRPVNALNNGLMDEKSPIANALVDLRNKCDDLDPSKQGDLLTPRKILGLIPFGNKLRDYFLMYESAQSHLDKTITALLNGQDELRKDNAAIEQEKATLWDLMSKMEKYIYLGKRIDEELETKVAQIEQTHAEKARVVKEEILYYVRQKVQDLLVNLAVNVQTYLSLDVVRKNNLELIKGVDRATTTTVQALRNAVMTAQALANQKLVLGQINALNETTSTLIQSTASMLKQQAGDVAKSSSEPAVQIDALKNAFKDIYEAIDTVNTYKVSALDSMKQTINVLEGEVNKAKTYMSDKRVEESLEAIENTNAKELDL